MSGRDRQSCTPLGMNEGVSFINWCCFCLYVSIHLPYCRGTWSHHTTTTMAIVSFPAWSYSPSLPGIG